MPTQVQRPPSEPLPVSPKSMQQHQALRLALGSILTPKRPIISSNSSGTASPAFFGSHSASGAHTPVGTPPVQPGSISYFPLAQGPNSSEHLHPHYGYGYHAHSHPHLPPSRLGPGRSTSSSDSPSESSSAHPSAPSSAHTSPLPGPDSSLMDIEPLSMPLPASGPYHPKFNHQLSHDAQGYTGTDPPGPPPPTPSSPTSLPGSISMGPAISQVKDISSSHPHTPEVALNVSPISSHPTSPSPGTGVSSANNLARAASHAKFLETLQSKSAWDALIHGSFS